MVNARSWKTALKWSFKGTRWACWNTQRGTKNTTLIANLAPAPSSATRTLISVIFFFFYLFFFLKLPPIGGSTGNAILINYLLIIGLGSSTELSKPIKLRARKKVKPVAAACSSSAKSTNRSDGYKEVQSLHTPQWVWIDNFYFYFSIRFFEFSSNGLIVAT